MKGQKILFSKQSDEWETPPSVIQHINNNGYEIGFDLASNGKNNICDKYTDDFFNLNERIEFGEWYAGDKNTVAYCNPPYSIWQEFVQEISTMQIPVIMLLPARTCTIGFHKFIYKKPGVRVEFLKGRIKFLLNGKPVLDKKGQPVGAPFPSMLIYFRC